MDELVTEVTTHQARGADAVATVLAAMYSVEHGEHGREVRTHIRHACGPAAVLRPAPVIRTGPLFRSDAAARENGQASLVAKIPQRGGRGHARPVAPTERSRELRAHAGRRRALCFLKQMQTFRALFFEADADISL